MKVHPTPKKRNVTKTQYGVASKKLRRLPHVFARVLELPISSNADVLIQETSDSLRFTVTTTFNNKDTSNMSEVRAHAIKILPGLTKVVIKGMDGGDDDHQLDVWRYRLPASTRPEMATASFSGGELVVTVPKRLDSMNGSDGGDDNDDDEVEIEIEEDEEKGWGSSGSGNGRLILVQ